ncbi:MAG: RDD family protein [Candidatus Hadarchaeia archaeon]
MNNEAVKKITYSKITASFPKRVLAWLIDQLIIASIILVYYFATGTEIFTSIEAMESNLVVLTELTTIITLSYFTILEGYFSQSIGKKILNLTVMDEEGQKPGYLRSFARRIGLVTPLINIIDALAILPTDKNQRIFDILSSTLVIEIEKEEEAINFLRTGKTPESIKSRTSYTESPESNKSLEKNIKGLEKEKKKLEKKLENRKIDEDRYEKLRKKYESRIKELKQKKDRENQ